MAKISQKIDLSPVINEINDNELDISTEHQLTRDNLTATRTSLETKQDQAQAAIEGTTTSEGGATRTAVNAARDSVNANIDSEHNSTRTTVNNARDNVKAEIVRQTGGSLYALLYNALSNAINAARDNIKSHVTAAKDTVWAKVDATQAAVNNVNSNVDAEANSVRSTVNSARDNVKSHVTALRGGVKSIQRGEAEIPLNSGTPQYVDVSISAVNTAKTSIVLQGSTSQDGESADDSRIHRGFFLNASTVRFERKAGRSTRAYVGYEIIEYY